MSDWSRDAVPRGETLTVANSLEPPAALTAQREPALRLPPRLQVPPRPCPPGAALLASLRPPRGPGTQRGSSAGASSQRRVPARRTRIRVLKQVKQVQTEMLPALPTRCPRSSHRAWTCGSRMHEVHAPARDPESGPVPPAAPSTALTPPGHTGPSPEAPQALPSGSPSRAASCPPWGPLLTPQAPLRGAPRLQRPPRLERPSLVPPRCPRGAARSSLPTLHASGFISSLL